VGSQLFKNFAHSTLAASLATGATSMSVPTGEGLRFPAITGSDYFLLVLQDATHTEVIKVTARTGDSMTIEREQEGTTSPATFATGTIVSLRLTAATLESAMNLATAHIADAAAAHAASAISNAPSGNLAATDLQGAVDELQTEIDGIQNDLTAAEASIAAVDPVLVGTVALAMSGNAALQPPEYAPANGSVQSSTGDYAALYAKYGRAFTVEGLATYPASEAAVPQVPPIGGQMAMSDALPTAARGHAAVTLSDGRVLVVGGYSGTTYLNSTYFGTPESTAGYGSNGITWAAGTALPAAKYGHTLTLLDDGRVLATGGIVSAGSYVTTTYFGTISGNTITWVAGSALPRAIMEHAMVQLSDGRLLLTGGYDGANARAETYFGTIAGNTITWAAGTSMPGGRYGHSLAVEYLGRYDPWMAGGLTTAVGGYTDKTYQLSISGNAITYNETTKLPIPLGYHRVVVLREQANDNLGLIMLIGGASTSDMTGRAWVGVRPSVFFGATMWAEASPLLWPKALHAAVRLNDDRVLVVGGYLGGTSETVDDCNIATLLKFKVKL
jgi:hypothetical protein